MMTQSNITAAVERDRSANKIRADLLALLKSHFGGYICYLRPQTGGL